LNANIPYLIKRWSQVEHLLCNLYTWNLHPHYDYPLRSLINDIDFDLSSGTITVENSDLNNSFMQLILDKKVNPQEIAIYTDGSIIDQNRMKINQWWGVQ